MPLWKRGADSPQDRDRLKIARRAVENAATEHAKQFKALEKELDVAESRRQKLIKRARDERDVAEAPAQLARVGTWTYQVQLFETHLETPHGNPYLTPDVKAWADGWGNVSNLNITGPGWTIVSQFAIDKVAPADVQVMANMINIAVDGLADTQARLAERAREADAGLAQALRDRSEVYAALSRLREHAEAHSTVTEAIAELDKTLSTAQGSEKDAAKARAAADQARLGIQQRMERVAAAQSRIEEEASYEEEEARERAPEPVPTADEVESPAKPSARGVTNINRSSEEELAALPGIGSVLAKRAVQLRQSRGGFHSFDEFVAALELKPHIAERLSQVVSVEPETTGGSTQRGPRAVDY